jgi:hypothetical protein
MVRLRHMLQAASKAIDYVRGYERVVLDRD